jgi:hypothetical protein
LVSDVTLLSIRLLAYSEVSMCDRIAEEPFLEDVFDTRLLGDGVSGFQMIGGFMVLGSAARQTHCLSD